MKLSDLAIFKEISEVSFNEIKNSSILYKFKIGQPMSFKNVIPSQVHIILEGEARLLSTENNQKVTIAKLGVGSLVGLASLIRTEGCEEVTASTEIKTITIPDKSIIDIYKKEISFRAFCNNNLFPADILSIVEKLLEKSNRSDISLRAAFNAFAKNSRILNITNDSKIKRDSPVIPY